MDGSREKFSKIFKGSQFATVRTLSICSNRIFLVTSGVRGTHEALASSYRSAYGWFDPAAGAEEPVDTVGHGTHCNFF